MTAAHRNLDRAGPQHNHRENPDMTPDGTHLSLYDRRIKLIVDVLRENLGSAADAAMSEDTAHGLAVRVLHALDYLPGAMPRSPGTAVTTSCQAGGSGDHTTDLDALDMKTCPACPHPLAAHDGIGTRFCRITVTRALSRRCSCPPGEASDEPAPRDPGGHP